MISWFRRLFRRRPHVKTPDVSAFIDRQQRSQANAIQVQKESQQTTRELKQANMVESIYLGRRQP